MRRLLLAGIAVVLFIGTTAIAQNPSIQLEGGIFKVVGWKPGALPSKGWSSVFAIYAGVGDVPPLLGTYAVENGILTFHPSFPIAPGVRYHTVFQSAGSASVEKFFDGPARETNPHARVTSVFPSGDVLPSNLLRIYIYFSAPMSRGEAAARIHFLDENGKTLQGTQGILLPGEELWDPTFQRLTMTLDPGRIKRGLTSNEKLGPPIAEGRRYTLVIDREWLDARGVPMVEGFRRSFRGGPAQRTPPDPKLWKITSPQSGTSMPLIVNFPVPMNYTLLGRMIQVAGEHGHVDGTISIERQETQWRFTPKVPWQSGDYHLIVDTAIEDLAGNHVGEAFDVDTFDHVNAQIATSSVTLPFKIR